jgi:hypothetical protein
MWAATERKHVFKPLTGSNETEEFPRPQALKLDESQEELLE